MKKVTDVTLEAKNLVEPLLGEIQSRHYFSSYYGLFKNKILFGLYKDGKLFFKFEGKHLPEILSHSETYQLQDSSLKICTRYFYFLPSDICANISVYSHWFDYILAAGQKCIKQKKIRNLLNMNLNLERLLYRNGVRTLDDFMALGEVNIFVRLIKNGEDINEMLLYKLYGARIHKIVYNLNEQEKRQLLFDVDEALYEAGLRKRFHKKY